MSKYYGKVVLVTGASSGIGKSVAQYLAQRGYRVYGTSRKLLSTGCDARCNTSCDTGSDTGSDIGRNKGSDASCNTDCNTGCNTGCDTSCNTGCNTGCDNTGGNIQALNKSGTDTSGGFVKMLQLDVCSEESVKAAVEEVLEIEGELGIVINNAGIGIAGSVEDTSPREAFLQFDTNFFGMHRVIRQVLPSMRKQGRGLIINISSVGAVFPIPYQSMYVAGKAAVELMSGSLRNELRPFGIKVALVEPGDTRTGFTGSRLFVEAGGESSAYAKYSKKSIAVMERDEKNGADPIAIAKVIEKITRRRNPPVCVAVGLQYKLLVFLKRLVPRALETYIVSKMYEG